VAQVDTQVFAAVEAELARIGLLLQHDRVLPSVTTLVAGQPIAGSWWGHARGHDIYALLVALEAGAGALAIKLINGKVTFVHQRLWPALFGVLEGRNAARAGLSELAALALERVEEQGRVRFRELGGLGGAPQLKKGVAELESRLLVHVASEHTPSGAHEKVLCSWAEWEKAHHGTTPHAAPEAGLELLRAAAGALGASSGAPTRLPWA
jgi:hypothetical protein